MFSRKIFALGALVTLLTLSGPVRAEEGPPPGSGETPHHAENAEAQERPEDEKDEFDFTERPEVGIPSYAVEKGWKQLEAGVATQSFKGGAASQFVVNALLRYGASDNVELRVASSFNNLAGIDGNGDTTLGAKWNFKKGSNSMALIGQVTIPSGAFAFRSTSAIPQLIFANDIETGKNGVLGYNIGFQAPVDAATNTRFVQGLFSEYYAWSIGKHTGAFIEYAVTTPLTFHGQSFQALNGGITYLLGRDTEIDIGYLKGMSGVGTIDAQPTIGFSHRWF